MSCGEETLAKAPFLVVEGFFYVKIASKRFISDQVELSIVICCLPVPECNSELVSLRP